MVLLAVRSATFLMLQLRICRPAQMNEIHLGGGTRMPSDATPQSWYEFSMWHERHDTSILPEERAGSAQVALMVRHLTRTSWLWLGASM